ncbi:MAG: BON domain-containing protein [Pseudomonadales bacterium]
MKLSAIVKSKVFSGVLLAALLTGCAGTAEHRSTGQYIDDSTIATKIKSTLLADKLTDGLDIEVEVNRGKVQLTGFADSTEEVRRAGEIAKKTKGVSAVDNELRVAEGSRRAGQYIDDKVLVGKVKAALVKAPDVSALDIKVEVNRGIVVLGGFVKSANERNAALRVTKLVNGVVEVENNIDIR